MLDRATIERLSQSPEKNAPLLNVALAEEGNAKALLSLARSAAVGPEALSVIGARVAAEGASVGHESDGEEQEAQDEPLDRLLIAHPRSPGDLRDAVAARHPGEAFFVLAAAAHPRATLGAIERAIDWPAASAVHDRLWLALIDPGCIPPLSLEAWAGDEHVLRREAAARLTHDEALGAALGRDGWRQVRRAVASNRHLEAERRRLAASDPAPEVRARAEGALSAHGELGSDERVVETARFAAALRAMETGGVLPPDVTRALSENLEHLDDEGALLAAQVLPRRELGALLEGVVEQGPRSSRAVHLAAGLSLRRPLPRGSLAADDGGEAGLAEVVYDAVKALSRVASPDDRLTGKARLAAWAAEGLTGCAHLDRSEMFFDLARGAIGAERMVLARGAAENPRFLADLWALARSAEVVPAALVELAWDDPTVEDASVIALSARIPKPKRRADDRPEDEIDFDPGRRSLDVLERVVLAATSRANVSPRSALAVVALDSRRVRYVLSAMPQWKGRLSGGLLARVLRQHAGALSAAQAETRARAARVEGWTERMMSEIEVATALALGHLTGEEVARRITIGRQAIDDGLSLASGAEARAALEGAASVAPILTWAAKNRAKSPAALAIWLLLERLDRVRASTLIAIALDGLGAGGGVVAPCVCDALSLLERRTPGRLETIHPQSPRGRATLASAIARAYRAVGGMRDEA